MQGPLYRQARMQLPNGLTVVTVAMPHLHTAQVSLYIRVGSRHETTTTNGLTHFLEHMVFRGCSGYPDSTALNSVVEDMGGTLDGYTMRDHSAYHASVHPDFIGDATHVLAAMFRTPTFPDIEIERSIILEEILDAVDERGRVIDLDTIAHRGAFTDHPLGWSIDGPQRNVARFDVTDLEAHRKTFFGARNSVLCFAGKIDDSHIQGIAAREFGDMAPGRRVKEGRPPPLQTPGSFAYVKTDEPQTRLRLSFRTVSDAHADYPALALVRRVLDGGLSSRLQVELVEKRGIAYEMGADFETYADCGLFSFEFAVAHSKLAYAIEELGLVLISLRERAPELEELDRVRRRARIAFDFRLDSVSEMSAWFGATQLFMDPMSPEDRLAELDTVTAAKVRQIARKYFKADRLTAAATGGADAGVIRAARKALRRLGEVLT